MCVLSTWALLAENPGICQNVRMAGEVLAALIGGLAAALLGELSGVHGWPLVGVVIVGALVAPSVLAAYHGTE